MFDDNEFGQMSNNYGVDMLDELLRFKGIIKHIYLSDIELDDVFRDATAIFIHASFPPDDFKSRVCFRAEAQGLPLVVFSGGQVATILRDENNNIILEMKKDRFYHYLIPFLKLCQNNPNEKVDIKKLVYGENYEIEKSLIIQDRLGIFLAGKIGNFNYETDFSGRSQEYKDLSELFYFLYPENHENEFSKFDEQISSAKEDAKSFLKKLKSLIHKVRAKYE